MTKKILLKKIVFCLIAILVLSSTFLFEKNLYIVFNNKIAKIENSLSQCLFQVHYINVGQGDAIAIKLPDGKNMLIDSGTEQSSTYLVNYLNKHFFKTTQKKLDYFVITHPHLDHIGGAEQIFESFEVVSYFCPNITDDVSDTENEMFFIQSQEKILNLAENEPNCSINYVDYTTSSIESNLYSIEFLSPFNVSYSVNDYSIIMLITYNDKKFVFTGDAEEYSEINVINYHSEKLKDIDVLKVGHHGSKTSSSSDFIHFLNPKYSVICVGRDNDYLHPNENVLNRLNGINSKILRTDNNGNIILGVSLEKEIVLTYEYENRLPLRIQVWQVFIVLSVVVCVIIFAINFDNKPKKDAIRKQIIFKK